jgi:microsomal dipeptidase-like Zn-dependent dipeptidase
MNRMKGLLSALSLAVAGGLAMPAQAQVVGYVDLHSHLMAEHAFGGSWYSGTTEGPIHSALARCDGNFGYGPGMGSHAATIFPGLSEALGADTGWHLGRRRGYDNRRCRRFFGITIPGTCPRPHFEHWPKWDAIAHQQMWYGHLQQAHAGGLRIMGVSLAESEFLCKTTPPMRRRYDCNEMASIKRQASFVRGFAARNSSWVGIAETPAQARALIAQGKLALVLTAEVTKLFPDGDYVQQLDELHGLGVRSLQVVHHADNRFSGTVPINSLRTAGAAVEFLTGSAINTRINDTTCRNGSGHAEYPLFPPPWPTFSGSLIFLPKCDGDQYLNEVGLSPDGKVLLNAMIDRGMILDVAHMSRKALKDAYAIAMARGRYPLTYSHTHLWSMVRNESGNDKNEKYLRDDEIHMITDTGGMIGLRTGPESTHTYYPPLQPAPVVNNCDGSSRSFAQSMMYAIDKGLNVGLGADFNGFIKQMKPSKGCTGTFVANDLYHKGLGHVGALPGLMADLKQAGVPQRYMDHVENNSAETYLRIWERSQALAGATNTNLARTATASASSTYCSSTSSPDHCYSPSRINDGDASTALGGRTSWVNNGYVAMPQWVQLSWSAPITASRLEVSTTSGYAIGDYEIEYWNGAAWVQLDRVQGNTQLRRTHLFTSPFTTTSIRILAYAGPGHQPGYARINEVEVYRQ